MKNQTKISFPIRVAFGVDIPDENSEVAETNEYRERNRPVELSPEHFESVSACHYDNGLKASVVFSKNGKVMGAVRMDHDAAEAMIAGMRALTSAWEIESECGSHLGYATHAKNLYTGVKVGVYR